MTAAARDPPAAGEAPRPADGRSTRSVEDELALMREENRSLRDDVGILRRDVETLLLRRQKDGETAGAGEPDLGGRGAASKNRKKKKSKAQKKRAEKTKGARCWPSAGGSPAKIAAGASAWKVVAGLVSLALLASMTLGQGVVGVGKDVRNPFAGGDGTALSPLPARVREKLQRALDSPAGIAAARSEDPFVRGIIGEVAALLGEQDGRGEVPGSREETSSEKSLGERRKKMKKNQGGFGRTLQANAAPHSYYLDPAKGYCSNDPSGLPEPGDGITLHETAEECCENE